MNKTVQVISVVPTVQPDSGDNQYQISFGEFVEVDPTKGTYFQQENSAPPKMFPVLSLILLMKFSKSPFTVGEKFELSVETNGELRLKKVED